MSPLKRRAFFGLAGLALLSVCLWAGYEFLNVARIKQSKQAAQQLCSSVKEGDSMETAIKLAKDSKRRNRLAVTSEELQVDFGHNCDCRLQIADQKVVEKKAVCDR